MTGIVYKIVNLIDRKVYVGKTIKKNRFVRHKVNAKRGVDTYLYRAMRLHGVENFEFSVIEETAELD